MNPIPFDPETGEELFEDTCVVSWNECTGLAATPPETESETESFQELYDIPLAEQVPPN